MAKFMYLQYLPLFNSISKNIKARTILGSINYENQDQLPFPISYFFHF